MPVDRVVLEILVYVARAKVLFGNRAQAGYELIEGH
jgi:hypothetical protein